MLCITAQHTSGQELAKQLEAAAQILQQKNVTFLLEFRFDALEKIDDAILSTAKRFARNAIFCVRSKKSGGFFNGTKEDQIQIIKKLSDLSPSYFDVDSHLLTQNFSLRESIPFASQTKVIASVHNFSGDWHTFENELKSIEQLDCDIIKGAITLSDASENLRLMNIAHSLQKPCVIIGMDEAGLLSRVRYRHFHSLWTYVSATETSKTAPGQINVTQALEWGLPKCADQEFVALLGNKSIRHSPGPKVYNALFRKKSLPLSYIPVPTMKPEITCNLLQKLGAKGASITVPYKIWAAHQFPGDELVKRIGAANSIKFNTDGTVLLSNTDSFGLQTPLQRATVEAGQKCLILGAGGATHAAIEACRKLSLSPIICARDTAKARTHFPKIPIIEWADRASTDATILINATILGGKSTEIWPAGAQLNKEIVFDCAMSTEPSRLLEIARQEKSITISAHDMWVAQGVRQILWLTGQIFSEEELRRELPIIS